MHLDQLDEDFNDLLAEVMKIYFLSLVVGVQELQDHRILSLISLIYLVEVLEDDSHPVEQHSMKTLHKK